MHRADSLLRSSRESTAVSSPITEVSEEWPVEPMGQTSRIQQSTSRARRQLTSVSNLPRLLKSILDKLFVPLFYMST